MESSFDWYIKMHKLSETQTLRTAKLDAKGEARMRVGRILVSEEEPEWSAHSVTLESIVNRVLGMTDEEVETFLRMYDLGRVVGA